jgi:hypothetical protein
MTKANRLQNALDQKARGPQPQPGPAGSAAGPARREATRAGKVIIGGWLPIEARASCRLILAHHPDKQMQDLVEEAFNDLFAKYNVPQTARAAPAVIAI